MVFLPRLIRIYTKFANFTGLYFFILQHFATKLCGFTSMGFTHSKMLFLAVVLDFVLHALIKIQSIAGITYYCFIIHQLSLKILRQSSAKIQANRQLSVRHLAKCRKFQSQLSFKIFCQLSIKNTSKCL